MMAYELDVPDQKGWDMQTYDNLVDNVCNAQHHHIIRQMSKVKDSLETVTHRVDIRYYLPYIINVNKLPLSKMYFDPKMTIDEYEDFKLLDEINIGYDVEDDDLPDEIERIIIR